MLFKIFSLFPNLFDEFKNTSVLRKAIFDEKIKIDIINIRDFGIGKYKSVDEKASGGIGGMVMRADVLSNTIDNTLSIEILNENRKDSFLETENPIIVMSARGVRFDQNIAKKLSTKKSINIVCGRFEGIDQRFIDYYNITEISIGDFILFGGETAAMVVIESVSRLIKDVIGNNGGERFDSFYEENKIEHPQYTSPREWNGLKIPDVLLSGNHKKIEEWKIGN